MSTSTKTKMQEVIAEAQGKQKRATTTSTKPAEAIVTSAKFDNIEGNTFFKIVFSDGAPETKKKAVAEALTYNAEQTKEQNAERLKEFDVFKEYLQEQRKIMAQELLALVNTGTFAELKSVIEDMNKGLIEFDERMKPLTDILDAVYKLSQAGSDTFEGIFKEIQEDKAAEEQRKLDIAATEQALQATKSALSGANAEILVLQTSRKHRTWLGFGGLKESAIREIAAQQEVIADTQAQLDAQGNKLKELMDPALARQSEYQEYLNEKSKLVELLDITSNEHTERQKALVEAVQTFINVSSAKTASVQGQLEGMREQIGGLRDANNGMRFIYSIVSEASGEAMQQNDGLRTKLDGDLSASTSEIEKLALEQKKGHVDDYLTSLHTSSVETAKTLGDLTSQGVRIKTMGDTNREQIGMIRELGSSGVAGMADRLAMAVNAVGAAATNESGKIASMSINSMNERTNDIVSKEAIRAATGLRDVATGLQRATQELIDYRELNAATTSITRENLSAILESMKNVEREAAELDSSLKELVSAQADAVVRPDAGPAAAKPAANANAPKTGAGGRMPSAFGKLGG